MAEIFGSVASILQVAEVGFSLATTLYKYAASVKGAEKEIKKVARDVRLTSKVLERTHEQLQADHDAQLCTDEALHDLEDVLDGCKEAFQELDEALSKSLKPRSGDKLSVSTFDKFKWPLRSNKLEVLGANLEKLKTTLLLMLSVLAYGSKVSQRHKQPDFGSIKVELTLEKLQIQNLVQAKDEATQRFEQLSAAFQNLEAGLNASEPSSASPVPGNSMISMLSSIDPQTAVLAPATTSEIESTDIDTTSNCLKLCANAVRKLASSIDAATQRWEASRALEYVAIQSALNKTTKAVTLLQASRNHDLSDYERQLMLLDEQNKKRILMARQEQGEATRAERSAHPQSNQALPPTVRSQVPGSDISRPQSQQATSRFPIQPLRARQPRTFTQSLPQRVSHHRREFAGHSQDFDTFDFADLDLHDDLDSSGLVSLLPAQENAAGNFDFSGVELEYVPNTTGNANTSSTPDSETPEESILDEKDCDLEYGGADDWEDDEVDVIDGLLRRWTKVAA